MSTSSRSCLLHHAWRCVALAAFVICLITALVPLAFGSWASQGIASSLGIILSGWFFLGLFWNSFVVGWETDRKELMHPGAVVALDLITWIYGVFAVYLGAASIAELVMTYNGPDYYDGDGYYYDYYDQLSQGDYNGSLACLGIFLIFAVASTVIHFTMFVAGCINEERRRKAEQAALASGTVRNPANVAAGTLSELPQKHAAGYLGSMNAAVADKQTQIELMERNFGNDAGDV